MIRKYLVKGALGLAVALAFVFMASSSAYAQTNSNNTNNNNNSNNTTVNAECGGDFNNTQTASAENNLTEVVAAVVGNVTQSGSGQSNSISQSASYSPTCNIVRQVQAPVGAVDAGLGGATAAPLFGLSGSLAASAYGLYRLRKQLR